VRLGISPFVIGLTVVGFGTSSPELAASIHAALTGVGDIAVGNVVGSNIFNIAVILGLTASLAPIAVDRGAVRTELLWTGAAALVPLIALIGVDGEATIGRVLGAVLVVAMAGYLVRAFIAGRRAGAEAAMVEKMATLGTGDGPKKEGAGGLWASVAFVVVGLVALVLGSNWLVDGAVEIARSLGLSERVIGLTIVAAGTSLPELVTSVMAAIKKRPELAVGNILGSNVFNAFAILGITALVRPQGVGISTLALDVPMTVVVTAILAFACLAAGRLGRVTGAVLLVGYAGYLVVLLTR
jgi:cation:H+ antiporter